MAQEVEEPEDTRQSYIFTAGERDIERGIYTFTQQVEGRWNSNRSYTYTIGGRDERQRTQTTQMLLSPSPSTQELIKTEIENGTPEATILTSIFILISTEKSEGSLNQLRPFVPSTSSKTRNGKNLELRHSSPFLSSSPSRKSWERCSSVHAQNHLTLSLFTLLVTCGTGGKETNGRNVKRRKKDDLPVFHHSRSNNLYILCSASYTDPKENGTKTERKKTYIYNPFSFPLTSKQMLVEYMEDE